MNVNILPYHLGPWLFVSYITCSKSSDGWGIWFHSFQNSCAFSGANSSWNWQLAPKNGWIRLFPFGAFRHSGLFSGAIAFRFRECTCPSSMMMFAELGGANPRTRGPRSVAGKRWKWRSHFILRTSKIQRKNHVFMVIEHWKLKQEFNVNNTLDWNS